MGWASYSYKISEWKVHCQKVREWYDDNDNFLRFVMKIKTFFTVDKRRSTYDDKHRHHKASRDDRDRDRRGLN